MSSEPYRFPAELVYDVYTTTRNRFKSPPIEGLDVAQLRPVGRHEAPERFGRNVLPQNGIPDPAPEVLEELLKSTYVYRVRLALDEPTTLEYLAYGLKTAESLAKACGGVIRDVQTGLVFKHEDARRVLKSPSFSISDHVLVHALREADDRGLWMHTHGMAKFGRPDVEARNVPLAFQPLASFGLLTLADYLSQGSVVRPGETMKLGEAILGFSKGKPSDTEPFPTGVLTIDDFDPATRSSLVGITRWLTTESR